MVGEAAAPAPAPDPDKPSGPSASGDFVIRHWRSSAPAARDPSLRGFRPATRPGELDLGRASPNGGSDFEHRPRAEEGTGYTSLRDLIDSPPPTGARSPVPSRACGGGGEIRIKNRLVKQAAYAYLQLTPSAAEPDRSGRRRRRSLRRALAILTCGLAMGPLDSCIDFLRGLFRRPQR